jgi:pantetheine-phosphate adenylyltransferase
MKLPIYALSADPLTNGHINIIERIIDTFGQVLVGIGVNPDKKYTFSLEERERLTKKVLAPYGDRVIVKSYSGLLTDFAYENELHTIIRGARNAADFDFEKLLADINGGLSTGLETYIMIADPKLSHISSSAVKELQEHQAKNIIDYVHPVVKEALELRISGQLRVGITGGIGNGKSYVEKKLVEINREEKEDYCKEFLGEFLTFHSIDMDVLGRYILKESKEPVHQTVREAVAYAFGRHLLVDGAIDVKSLLKQLFDDPNALSRRSEFEGIMAEPIMHLVRKNLLNKKGIVLISFVFVTCPEDVRTERLKKRGYSDLEIKNRLNAQLSPETKLDSIKKLIYKQSCGEVIEFNNLAGNDRDLFNLYQELKTMYKGKL